MKRVIGGKLYNTDTAKIKATYESNHGKNNFEFFSEDLYLKKTGEFFIHGKGGPNSKYCDYFENTRMAGEAIKPLTIEEAKNWAETNLSVEGYQEVFGDIEE